METKKLNHYQEIYEFLVSGKLLMPKIDELVRSIEKTAMERVYLKCLRDFRDSIPLYGKMEVINLILNKAVRVLSLQQLLRHPAIAVSQSDAYLVHSTVVYRFIATMDNVNAMISRGLYPQTSYVDNVKHRDPPMEEEERRQWEKEKNAQRLHIISFIDFNTISDPKVNQIFVKLFELTGAIPLINLSTAHDGRNSLRMTLSLVDVSSGTDGIVTAYPSESMFGVRIIHTKGLATDAVINEGIVKMSLLYSTLSESIVQMQSTILTKKSVKVLSEKIMSTILFKRVWERGIITCAFQQEMNSLVGKNVWDALIFIQNKLYHPDGIPYSMDTSHGIMAKIKKFNTERIAQKKVIFGAVFTACNNIT